MRKATQPSAADPPFSLTSLARPESAFRPAAVRTGSFILEYGETEPMRGGAGAGCCLTLIRLASGWVSFPQAFAKHGDAKIVAARTRVQPKAVLAHIQIHHTRCRGHVAAGNALGSELFNSDRDLSSRLTYSVTTSPTTCHKYFTTRAPVTRGYCLSPIDGMDSEGRRYSGD